MREITVHCDAGFESVVVCPEQSFPVSGADTEFSGTMQDFQIIMFQRQFVKYPPCAVGRIVIHEQYIAVQVEGLKVLHQFHYIFTFIVCRYKYEDLTEVCHNNDSLMLSDVMLRLRYLLG